MAADNTGARLAWWPRFYEAWRAADPEERAQAYRATLDYRAGLIDATTEISDVGAALGLAIPTSGAQL